MSSNSIRATLDRSISLIDDRIKRNDISARRAVLQRIKQDTDVFVPYKTGKLSKSARISVAANTVKYNCEYASYAFNPIAPSGRPKNYTTTVHPLAQGYPFQKAYEVHSAEWAELYRKELLKN